MVVGGTSPDWHLCRRSSAIGEGGWRVEMKRGGGWMEVGMGERGLDGGEKKEEEGWMEVGMGRVGCGVGWKNGGRKS